MDRFYGGYRRLLASVVRVTRLDGPSASSPSVSLMEQRCFDALATPSSQHSRQHGCHQFVI